MTYPDNLLDLAQRLVFILERLSADSTWAHQASGLRGSMLRAIEQVEAASPPGPSPESLDRLNDLIKRGFQIIEAAASEIRTPELKDLI